MWKWLKRRFGPAQPQPWAVQGGRVWVKLVSQRRPRGDDLALGHRVRDVQGPFRSEMDAEEFCDRANLAQQNIYTPYDKAFNVPTSSVKEKPNGK